MTISEEDRSPYATLIGILVLLLTLPGLLSSLFCIVIVIRMGYLKKAAPVIYKVIFHLLVADTSQLVTIVLFCKCSFILSPALPHVY